MEYIGKKISVVKKENELSIVISAGTKPRESYMILFWLACWTFCGAYILYSISQIPSRDSKIFGFVFAAFWIYFEVRTFNSYMWKRYGREVIKIKDGKFFIKKDIRKRGKIHAYEIEFIKDLRKRMEDKQSFVNILSSTDWLMLREALVFDCAGKEIKFGYQLNEEDAQALLKLIRYHLKK